MENLRSLAEIKNLMTNDELSLVDLCKHYLNKIKNSNSNAFIEVFEDEALRKAKEIEEKFKTGNAGLLAGMIIGIKDNICYKDHCVSASSKILENFNSLFSATSIQNLIAEVKR